MDPTIHWVGEITGALIYLLVWGWIDEHCEQRSPSRWMFLAALCLSAIDSLLKFPRAFGHGPFVAMFHLSFVVLPFVVWRRVLNGPIRESTS